MKTALLLVTCLLLASCQTSQLPAAFFGLLDKDFEIGLNETIIINGKKSKNKTNALGSITFTNLEESRCPANAMCIRQGAAVTTFKISTHADQEVQIIRMFVGDFMAEDPRQIKNKTADTVAVQLVDKVNYLIILNKVTPYPGTGNEKNKATLTIKKK